MSIRVGINGLGRIGRAVYRQLLERRGIDVVAINDVNPDAANLAYLLRYDTLYGPLSEPVEAEDEGTLRVRGRRIALTHEVAIDRAAWEHCDVVVDASGDPENAKRAHRLPPHVKACIVTNASTAVDFTLLFGVNEQALDLRRHRVIGTSICDANACAPVLAALDDAFGVAHGFVTTLHPWLGYQNLLDGAPPPAAAALAPEDRWVLGRASVGNLIPKPTSVVAACEQVLPNLAGALQCFSYRVPTATVSSADLSIVLERPASKASLIEALSSWQARHEPYDVLRLSEEPLVSSDHSRSECSATIDTRWMMVAGGTLAKVVCFYDNEWGYASRVVDAISLAGASIAAPRPSPSLPLVAFDFDGVLCDSVDECYATALAAYRSVQGDGDWQDLADDPAFERMFRRARWLVGPPWQYTALIDALLSCAIDPGDADPYLEATTRFRLAKERRRPAAAELDAAFFTARSAARVDRERWLGLHRPFEAAIDVLAEHARHDRAIILSTKDEGAIEAWLGAIGVAIDPRTIHGHRALAGREKAEVLDVIAAARRVYRSELHFVDDNIDHLFPALDRGYACHLAEWGYIGPNARRLALDRGIHVASLADLGTSLARRDEGARTRPARRRARR